MVLNGSEETLETEEVVFFFFLMDALFSFLVSVLYKFIGKK